MFSLTCGTRLSALGSFLLFAGVFLSLSSPALGGDRFEKFKARTKARFADVSWVSVETLGRWIKEKKGDDLLLLDTRSREEFEVSHLAAAHLASTLEEIRPLLAGLSRDHLIVTYCSVGYRSAVMAGELRNLGFVNVHNLEGSLFEWANKGYPVFRGGERADKVHFYNFWWGMYLNKELWAW